VLASLSQGPTLITCGSDVNNLTIYTMAFDDETFIELDDLISDLDGVHLDMGRPVGDALDQSIDMMMFRLANKHEISFTCIDGNNYVFHPRNLSSDFVNEQWVINHNG
jgi:hypothetical protein